MRLLERLFARFGDRPAEGPRHRATGPSTSQHIRALTHAPTTHLPRVIDGPTLLTPAQAHRRAATYRSASLPTPDDAARAAAIAADTPTRPMGRAELLDTQEGGDRGQLVRPYATRPA